MEFVLLVSTLVPVLSSSAAWARWTVLTRGILRWTVTRKSLVDKWFPRRKKFPSLLMTF